MLIHSGRSRLIYHLVAPEMCRRLRTYDSETHQQMRARLIGYFSFPVCVGISAVPQTQSIALTIYLRDMDERWFRFHSQSEFWRRIIMIATEIRQLEAGYQNARAGQAT